METTLLFMICVLKMEKHIINYSTCIFARTPFNIWSEVEPDEILKHEHIIADTIKVTTNLSKSLNKRYNLRKLRNLVTLERIGL